MLFKKSKRIISTMLSAAMLLASIPIVPVGAAAPPTPCTFGGTVAPPINAGMTGAYVINGNALRNSTNAVLDINVHELIDGTCIEAGDIGGLETEIWSLDGAGNGNTRQLYFEVNGVSSPMFNTDTTDPTRIWMPRAAVHGVSWNFNSTQLNAINANNFTIRIRSNNAVWGVGPISLLDKSGNVLGTIDYSTQNSLGAWSAFIPDCECCQFCGFDPCECLIDEKCKFGGTIAPPTGTFGNYLNGNIAGTSGRGNLEINVLELIDGTAIKANEIYGIQATTWGPSGIHGAENRQAFIRVNGVDSPRFHSSSNANADWICAFMSHGSPASNGGRTEFQTLRYLNIYGGNPKVASNIVTATPFVASASPATFDVVIRPNDNHTSVVTSVILLGQNGSVLGATSYSTLDANGTWSRLESFVNDCICGLCDIDDGDDDDDDEEDDEDDDDTDSGTKTYSKDDYDVKYVISNSWIEDGQHKQTVIVTITNTSNKVIENWMLAYNFNGRIEGIWNASVEKTETLGLDFIRNMGYNATIDPGQSQIFGYTLTSAMGAPVDMVMCQERVLKNDGFNATLNVLQQWQGGFIGEIVLENTTDKPIEWWDLTFNTNFTISQILSSWAATLTTNGNDNYTFKGTYTGIIAPHSSVQLGFQAAMTTTPEIYAEKLYEFVVDEAAVYAAIVAKPSPIFVHDGWLLYSISRDTVTIHGFAHDNYDPNLVIPDKIGDRFVTRIGAGAFAGTNITSVALPITGRITVIDDFAFTNCVNLTEIVIPNSVTTIGVGAFHDCVNLATVVMSVNVTDVNMASFGNCPKLDPETVLFPNGANVHPETFYQVLAALHIAPITPGSIVGHLENLAGAGKSDSQLGTFVDNIPNNIGNTFGEDSKTTRIITWQTNATITSGHVIFDAIEANTTGMTKLANSNLVVGNTRYHRVELDGLKVNTEYTFICGTPGNYSKVYTFKTEPETLGRDGFTIMHVTDPQIGISGRVIDAMATGGAELEKASNEYQASLWNKTLSAGVKRIDNLAFTVCTGDMVNVSSSLTDPSSRINGRLNHFFDYAQDILANNAFVYSLGNNEDRVELIEGLIETKCGTCDSCVNNGLCEVGRCGDCGQCKIYEVYAQFNGVLVCEPCGDRECEKCSYCEHLSPCGDCDACNECEDKETWGYSCNSRECDQCNKCEREGKMACGTWDCGPCRSCKQCGICELCKLCAEGDFCKNCDLCKLCDDTTTCKSGARCTQCSLARNDKICSEFQRNSWHRNFTTPGICCADSPVCDCKAHRYAFEYGDVLFINVDSYRMVDDKDLLGCTTCMVNNSSACKTQCSEGWLGKQLKDKKPNIKWTVVTIHESPFGRQNPWGISPDRPSVNASRQEQIEYLRLLEEYRVARRARQKLANLLDKYSVDLVLGGHNHLFGLSHQIDSRGRDVLSLHPEYRGEQNDRRFSGTVYSIPNVAASHGGYVDSAGVFASSFNRPASNNRTYFQTETNVQPSRKVEHRDRPCGDWTPENDNNRSRPRKCESLDEHCFNKQDFMERYNLTSFALSCNCSCHVDGAFDEACQQCDPKCYSICVCFEVYNQPRDKQTHMFSTVNFADHGITLEYYLVDMDGDIVVIEDGNLVKRDEPYHKYQIKSECRLCGWWNCKPCETKACDCGELNCEDCKTYTCSTNGRVAIHHFGNVTGLEEFDEDDNVYEIYISDALEILKCIVGIDNLIDKCEAARKAALIIKPEATKPTTGDALDILKYIVKLESSIIFRKYNNVASRYREKESPNS